MTNPENKTFPTPPILLIIFARSECVRKVIASIRTARPSKIFIAQDAPRPNRPDDVENCRLARETTLAEIDWDCEIKTLFQEKNLGAGKGCAAAIQWFFENVEEGIVLEDDDLPEPSFFPYCAELLDKYRNDTRVMHIAGYNPLLKPVSDDSYYFSKLMHCWGFATWRRVIKQYDYKISSWHKLKKTGHMRTIFRQRFPRWHFTKEFEGCELTALWYDETFSEIINFNSSANCIISAKGSAKSLGLIAIQSQYCCDSNESGRVPEVSR